MSPQPPADMREKCAELLAGLTAEGVLEAYDALIEVHDRDQRRERWWTAAMAEDSE